LILSNTVLSPSRYAHDECCLLSPMVVVWWMMMGRIDKIVIHDADRRNRTPELAGMPARDESRPTIS